MCPHNLPDYEQAEDEKYITLFLLYRIKWCYGHLIATCLKHYLKYCFPICSHIVSFLFVLFNFWLSPNGLYKPD